MEERVIVQDGGGRAGNLQLEEIQYIDRGRLVLSRCEKTGQTAYRKVLQQYRRESIPAYEIWTRGHNEEGDYFQSGPITATAEHPFWVQGKGWTPVIELRPGDLFVSCWGYEVAVSKVNYFGTVPVANIEVEEFNTFFLAESGIWVHNCNAQAIKGSLASVAQSGKDRFLTGPPHTTRHAGPHRAVHHQGAHDFPHA